ENFLRTTRVDWSVAVALSTLLFVPLAPFADVTIKVKFATFPVVIVFGMLAATISPTVTDQSTLVVRKKFSQITAANGDVVTIRLDYQNPTNTIVPTATLTDTLGSNLTYEVNTGKWNGVTVYD
ncbi:hypothetical protein ACT453_32145, partial [Bacillus sp. D-CC]